MSGNSLSQRISRERMLILIGAALGTVSIALAGCSSEESGTTPVAAQTSIGAEQGGQPAAEQAKTQDSAVAFKANEQLFVNNGEQATFEAITKAIALSEQGDVEGSAKILTGLGLNQEMVARGLTLDEKTAQDDKFKNSFEEKAGRPFTSASHVIDSLGPDVIDALPMEETNDTQQTSEVLAVKYHLMPRATIDRITKDYIIKAPSNKDLIETSTEFTEEEKRIRLAALEEGVSNNKLVRSQEGLEPVGD